MRHCRNLQSPQMRAARVGQPGQHSAHIGARQSLTRGPQPGGVVVFGSSVDAQQPLHVELPCGQCRAKRAVRRARQHHQAARRCSLQRTQCWRDQPPLVLPRLGLQHFSHGTTRPAATWQHAVECVVPRANGLRIGTTQLARTPDVGELVKQCWASLSVDDVKRRCQDEIRYQIKILFIYTVFCLDFNVLQLTQNPPYQVGWALWFAVWMDGLIGKHDSQASLKSI